MSNRTLLLLAPLLGCVVLSAANAQAAKPNIVVIWGDDIGRTKL